MAEYLVSVVDDEVLIADSLADLIREHWKEEVEVRTFYNARSLLNSETKTPCDLLITDIRMPGMTGLEMTGELRRMGSEAEVIVLTGYDLFDYAYEAIKNQTFGYLLKNDPDDRVLAVIGQALEKIKTHRSFLNTLKDAQSAYQELHKQLQRQQLRDYLTEVSPEPPELLPEKSCFLPILTGVIPDEKPEVLLSLVSNSFLNCPEVRSCESMIIHHDMLWLVILSDKGNTESIVHHVLMGLQPLIERHFHGKSLFAVSHRPMNREELPECYSRLRSVHYANLFAGEGGIVSDLTDNDSDSTEIHNETGFVRFLPAQCLSALEEGNLDVLHHSMESLCTYLELYGSSKETSAMQFFLELVSGMYAVLRKYKIDDFADLDKLHRLTTLSIEIPWERRCELIRQVMDSLYQAYHDQEHGHIAGVMARVRSYVVKNLAKDLSTAAIARKMGYSEAHLSKVFKSSQDITLHDYVKQERMRRAQDLLRETDDRIYQIAMECGYANTAYFIRAFRGEFGVTPQEYRDGKTHGN